ncbi:Radical SAM superfamily protein [Planctomycetes bacterium Poly30]|uniref:Radical SAM superfamily protein n=1 Tax=Saltatorellus ferox TaxID=2528018 RepID=A0A518ESA9_9BACT|nr:Radical SAM superfamily protein [Planctomycetes bacterium Poly30]
MNNTLTTEDHSRDAAHLTHIYPVVSRRARGVSVGINLNPNNACNWACAYCQVPDLQLGAAPPIDLDLLETELRGFLAQVTTDEWMELHAPPEARRINDIAFSGNGEPTTARDFDRIVQRVLAVRAKFPAMATTKTVLITNGSQAHQPHVLRGLRRMAEANGEVWFKIDSATREGRRAINGTDAPLQRASANLRAAASACRTLVQTCVFGRDGQTPSEAELDAYVAFLQKEIEQETPLKGVLLYGLARPSLQPGAERLHRLDDEWIQGLAARIEQATGLPVEAHA